MSSKSTQNDPSMVEILGSIRRIINEDNAETGPAVAASGGDEEILDLTEEVAGEDSGEPRPVTAFGMAPAATDEPEARQEPVLGLHSPSQPDGEPVMEQPDTDGILPVEDYSEFDGDAAMPMEDFSEFNQQDEQDMVSEEDDSVPMPDPPVLVHESLTLPEEAPMPDEPAPVFQPTPAESEEVVRTVISESTSTATASALGELTRVMDEKTNQLKVGSEGPTVADMVKELMRPMLREWLDENLPTIVDRTVRREIQKLVDQTEPDD